MTSNIFTQGSVCFNYIANISKATIIISVSNALLISCLQSQKVFSQTLLQSNSFHTITVIPEKHYVQTKLPLSGIYKEMKLNYDQASLRKDSTSISSTDINIYFSMGISYASDYANTLTSALKRRNPDRELTGFNVWYNFETGLEFRIIKSLYFLSSFAIQWSHIKVPSGYFPSFINDGKAWDNTLYSFGFGGSYYIPIKDTYVYLSFSILNSLSNFGGSDSDLERDFEYKPKGSGLKFSLGLAAPMGKKSKAVIELGYKKLPVTINVWNSQEYSSKLETKNFGGIFLNASFSFGLITF